MSDLNTKFELEFAKTRNVKSPSKAYDRPAGWDFYVPENLRITDFTKNIGIYLNEFLVHKENCMSPMFLLKNKSDSKELWVRFYLDKEYNKIRYINCNSGKTIIEEWNTWIEAMDTYVVSIDLEPNEKVLIPSGIHVKLPNGIFLNAENKSGIASKRGLLKGSSLIDQDYQGEIHINLINCANNTSIINAGDKIIQFVPYFQPNMNGVREYGSIEELYKNTTTERGSSGFGSSDNMVKKPVEESQEIKNPEQTEAPGENKKNKLNKTQK